MTHFYTIDEVAERLGVSQKTVRRHIASGRLSAHDFGTARESLLRISADSVQGFIDSSLAILSSRSPREPLGPMSAAFYRRGARR